MQLNEEIFPSLFTFNLLENTEYGVFSILISRAF